jgi:hypothetical protein
VPTDTCPKTTPELCTEKHPEYNVLYSDRGCPVGCIVTPRQGGAKCAEEQKLSSAKEGGTAVFFWENRPLRFISA